MLQDTMELLWRVCVTWIMSLLFVHSAFSTILYSCTFEDVSSCWLNVEAARLTWMIGGHRTDPSGQGPPADHTWGTEVGKYVYTRSEDKVVGTPLVRKLTSAHFQLAIGEGVLSFYFFLWGSPGNTLNVYAECNSDMSLIWGYGSSTGLMNSWTRAEALVLCNDSFTIIFQSIHNFNNSFIAVDDITLNGKETDSLVSVKTPTTGTNVATEDVVKEPSVTPDVTSESPQVHMNTMPTGGVYNQPQGTMTLSIILFLLALLFMIVSLTVHCYIWHKRKKCAVRMRTKQINVHNSGYSCPVHSTHLPKVVVHSEDYKMPTTRKSELKHGLQAEKPSVKSTESGTVANGGLPSSIALPILRGRSKTVPNKRSFEHYEAIEMGSDSDEDSEKGKRVLSATGNKRKKGFVGKARHFTRSNSLPTSPGNDFYESIDHSRINPAPLAYQVTDLLPSLSSTNTLVDELQDTRSSIGSIPSIQSNHLKPPMLYDNLERKSPLLSQPSRHSPTSSNYTPPSLLNLSGSQCNVASLYDTVSTSQADASSLSSYDTPTVHMDSSPQVNPFFQSVQPSEMYNALNRHPRPNTPPVIGDGSLTPSPPSPAVFRPSAYQMPQPKPKDCPPQQNEYHTLDPDAISDTSFEKPVSVDSETAYESPQTKTLQQVKSESSHDYEDLD
ncbi:uncharacterized protein LOC110978129 isoform X2 [Acanthaster planci]|uniref:Uncharacterized protein LOC110978129 isoform X2 n=1 Tax=Acanthaster planci TaxID=133434 RepID=A0A8B7Y5V0_ACAPL|nr:uncharacterized protein LOC110978129 isoform X2 [Acanthaster planci]